MRWPLFLLLPLLCFASWSCNQAGKTVAGGEGDPSLFDQVPANPSVPVVYGTFAVQIGEIATNPVGNPPERYDRYAALRDTTIIIVAPGPSSNTLSVRGAYLDPRIDDQLYLQDRGNNLWVGRSGIGSSAPFTVSITTDGAGNVLQYIVQMVSTSTAGGIIATRRTFDRVPNAIYIVLGLKYCRVRDAMNWPPYPGDFFNCIVSGTGLVQWEQDTFEQKYRFNPLIGLNEAQVTTYDESHNPPNIEHYNTMDVLPPPVGSGTNHEFNHNSGVEEQWVDFSPPPLGGWIAPLNCSGHWHGLVSNPSGVFQSNPYLLRHHQSDVVMTVNSPALTATINARCVWDTSTHTVTTDGVVETFNIIRLEGNKMIAVRRIAANTYDLLTLIRDETSSSPILTPHTPYSGPINDTKSLTIQRFANGINLGSYNLGPDSTFPLEWWP